MSHGTASIAAACAPTVAYSGDPDRPVDVHADGAYTLAEALRLHGELSAVIAALLPRLLVRQHSGGSQS